MSEPTAKPKRMGWRRWRWLVVVVGMILCVFVARSQIKHVVQPGMSRSEVRAKLLFERAPQFTTMCVLMKPGSIPAPGYDYPTPFNRVEYPEYGFDVIYHGRDVLNQDGWTVVAVEDRK